MNSRIVLVTGLSGAGKTTAMGVLEELGYLCMDRFPVELCCQLRTLIKSDTSDKYRRLALSVSAQDFSAFQTQMKDIDRELRTLYLDAETDQLLLRYKYARRVHPLVLSGRAPSLAAAIELEKIELQGIKDTATIHIDTTHLRTADLKLRIQELFAADRQDSFFVSFISFGYRYGIPQDADLVFDVRFLVNPYWEPELRGKTGDDPDVYRYVMHDGATRQFLEELTHFLDVSFRAQRHSGKNHFSVAIGCTGGQHRSVSVVNYLYQHYQDQIVCYKDHRDLPQAEVL